MDSSSFEELIQFKDDLEPQLHKEEILKLNSIESCVTEVELYNKHFNNSTPRELSSKQRVPYFGNRLRNDSMFSTKSRDPRFDSSTGKCNLNKFKENYEFLLKFRRRDIKYSKCQQEQVMGIGQNGKLKIGIQRSVNIISGELKRRSKVGIAKVEQFEIKRSSNNSSQRYHSTKKEKRAEELLRNFKFLKKNGNFDKFLEKKRKKNIAKDRKRVSF